MKYGISSEDLKEIFKVLQDYPEIDEALIFGSRAKETYRKGSDVDIALKGRDASKICLEVSYKLNEETLLPYFFDILVYKEITNKDLQSHINRVGKTIYKK